ncbi:MAG: biotin--[acetyl-CoA-carboxylase] ligase [Anaerolineae bacterium]
MLSQEALTIHVRYPFKYLQSVKSTNDIAREWLEQGAETLSTVISDEQRAGRGRRGRVWYTPPEVALALSVVLKPTLNVAPRVTMLGALAVYDLCQSLQIDGVGIKWPNDVQIHGKKVSGVLAEAAWRDGQLLGVILGVGVNVRNQLSEELAPIATTLANETTQQLDRAQLVGLLVDRIAHWHTQIATNALLTTWRTRLTTLGLSVVVEGVNRRIVGQAVATDQDGALLIKTTDGSIQRILAGDVSLRTQHKD